MARHYKGFSPDMPPHNVLSELSPTFLMAEQIADEQMKALEITENHARTYAIRREGKRPGLRVTTIRLTDGMTKTKFIPD